MKTYKQMVKEEINYLLSIQKQAKNILETINRLVEEEEEKKANHQKREDRLSGKKRRDDKPTKEELEAFCTENFEYLSKGPDWDDI